MNGNASLAHKGDLLMSRSRHGHDTRGQKCHGPKTEHVFGSIAVMDTEVGNGLAVWDRGE